MKFGVLALDYDGTIAQDGLLAPEIRPAIAEARANGIVVIIATGRILSDLRSLCGDLSFVDAVVAENGAVLAFPNGQTRILGRLPPQSFFNELQQGGVAFRSGQCIVEADASAAPAILAAIRELQLPARNPLQPRPPHGARAGGQQGYRPPGRPAHSSALAAQRNRDRRRRK